MSKYFKDVDILLREETQCSLNEEEKTRCNRLKYAMNRDEQVRSFFSFLLESKKRGISLPTDLLSRPNDCSDRSTDSCSGSEDYLQLLNRQHPNLFKFAFDVFINLEISSEERILASRIVSHQIIGDPSLLDSPSVETELKRVALTPIYHKSDTPIHLIAFQCLKHTMHRLGKFPEIYYTIQVKPYVRSQNSADLIEIDTFIATSTNADKFHLLQCLSFMMSNEYPIELSIFTDFEPMEWRKELLSYTIMVSMFGSNSDTDEASNFLVEISALSDFIDGINSSQENAQIEIESVLEILIHEIHEHQYDFFQTNTILFLLQADAKNLLLVLNRNYVDFSALLEESERLWLAVECTKNGIQFTNDAITQFQLTLTFYDLKTVKDLLGKVKSKTNLSEIAVFFESLNESFFTPTNKTIFLRKVISNNSQSPYDWRMMLCSESVGYMMQIEFPFYECYRNEESEEQRASENLAEISAETFNHLSTYGKCGDEQKIKFLNALAKEHSNEKCKSLNTLLNDLHNKIAKLIMQTHWTMSQLSEIVRSLDSPTKIQQLILAFNLIAEYDLKECSKVVEVFRASTEKNVIDNIHKYAIITTLPKSVEKNLQELIHEITENNRGVQIKILDGDNLLNAFNKISSAFQGQSQVFPHALPISEWDKSHIYKWAQSFQANTNRQSDVYLYEKIAVLNRTHFLVFDFYPRDVKMLSLLIMLHKDGKGRLAQINTGEGKTSIISMLAAFHALDGHQVDIITSSPVLAIPQSEQQEPFYRTLGLTVAHNIKNNKGYKAMVCYGTPLYFQADVLRDEYGKRHTRHGRKFDIVIVDEVDNMLVDLKNHIVMISKSMPAMNHLEPVLAAIVCQVDFVAKSLLEKNGQTFILDPNYKNENGVISAESDVTAVPVYGTKDEVTKNLVIDHIESLLRIRDHVDEAYPKLSIPKHLMDLCKYQIPKWTLNAIRAKFHYVNQHHYILRNDKITPVDAENTGTIEENMHWNEGLHQFLEIKHGTKLNPQSLTSNYISNVGFFKRYGKNIYGMTGTLGNDRSKQFLNQTYDADSVIIPPFKTKIHKILTPLIVNSSVNDWYAFIVKNCIEKLNAGRAVLIMVMYIEQTSLLAKIFEEKFNLPKSKIRLYQTDLDSKVVEKKVTPGEVIITTNIAGRGTDIKVVKQIDENGGLHVCLTFLPVNERVENQNMGRTSRTGNRGTSQIILYDRNDRDFDVVKNKRNKLETEAFVQAEKEVTRVINKDTVFKKFCNLLDSIKGRKGEPNNHEKDAVEERFAMWSALNDEIFHNNTIDEVLQKFSKFEQEIFEDDIKGNLIRNPYFYIQVGIDLVHAKNFTEAIEMFKLAIDLDENFAENAYYNRGFALISEYGYDLSKNKKFIDNAISDFEKARRLIELRKRDLGLIQKASSSDVYAMQINHKLHLLDIQVNAIDEAIGPDISAIEQYIENLKSQRKRDGNDEEEITKAIEEATNRKMRVGTIQQAREKKYGLSIEFTEIDKLIRKDDFDSYKDEIEEFKRNGYTSSFEISEIKPIDWGSVFGLLAMGLGQIILGAALMVFSLGASSSFALGLIMEGVSDVVTAIKDGILNRNFTWESWAIQKAISFSISIICAGISVVKGALAAGKNILQNIGKGVVQQIGTGVKAFKGLISPTLTKEGWVLVAKKIGTELAKTVAKETVSELILYGLDKILIPFIESEIRRIVEGILQTSLINNPDVEVMLKHDELNNNFFYENLIIEEGMRVLGPKTNAILQITERISAGIIARQNIKPISSYLTKIEIAKALANFSLTLPSLIGRLNKFVREQSTMRNLTDELKKIEKALKHEENKKATKEKQKETALNPEEILEEQIQLQKPKRSPTEISRQLSLGVSENLTRIIQDQLIRPVVKIGVNYSVENISRSVDDSVANSIYNYKAHRNIIYEQNKGYKHLDIKEGVDKNLKNKSNDLFKSAAAVRKVEKLIIESETGPSGLYHLGAVSDATDRPVKVYDGKGRYKFTIGKNKKGNPIKLQYEKPPPGSVVGHFTGFGGKEATTSDGGENMCLYNVVADQTGVKPQSLKENVLNIMENNKVHISKQSSHIARLEMYDNAKLIMGGAKYSGDAKQTLDESEGGLSFGFPNPGHPRGHASSTDPTVSRVESYSQRSQKSGFVSRDVQDTVVDMALRTPVAENAMNELNKYSPPNTNRDYIDQVITVSPADFRAAGLTLPNTALAGKWKNGVQKGATWKVSSVKLVLRHRAGSENDPGASVHVQTAFPL